MHPTIKPSDYSSNKVTFPFQGIKSLRSALLKKDLEEGRKYSLPNIFKTCCSTFRFWSQRYIIITCEAILIALSPFGKEKSKIREMLLFDKHMKVNYGKAATGHEHGITISTLYRQLQLQALSEDDYIEILVALFMAS
jgi:hypothetical protein